MEKSIQERWNKVVKEHWWLRGRYRIVRSLIDKFASLHPKGSLRCLDIGCSGGHMMEFLKKYGEVYGFDISFDGLKLFEADNSRAIQADASAIPFKDGSFDLVVLLDVAEHLQDDTSLFRQINRVCRDGAYVFVTVPAHMLLWGSHDVKYLHKRRYSKKQFLDLVETSGFRVKYFTFLHPHLFIPMAIFRTWDRIYKKNIGKRDDFFSMGSFIDGIFSITLAFENALIKRISFPFGIAIFCLLEKKPS